VTWIGPAALAIAGLLFLLGKRERPPAVPPELAQLALTSTGLPNDPPPETWPNLRRVLAALEGIRARWGRVELLSAYRSPAVNAAVGGVADSLHLEGRAVDFRLATPALTRQCFESWVSNPAQVAGAIQETILYDTARPRIHLGLCLPGACAGPRFSVHEGISDEQDNA